MFIQRRFPPVGDHQNAFTVTQQCSLDKSCDYVSVFDLKTSTYYLFAPEDHGTAIFEKRQDGGFLCIARHAPIDTLIRGVPITIVHRVTGEEVTVTPFDGVYCPVSASSTERANAIGEFRRLRDLWEHVPLEQALSPRELLGIRSRSGTIESSPLCVFEIGPTVELGRFRGLTSPAVNRRRIETSKR